MILDIGCGQTKNGDIGLDSRKTKFVDIIADARKLPFKSETFEHVFSSAVIEHFSHREVHNVVCEWTRVLKEGGKMEIACPDLRARALLFFLNPSWKNIEDVYGRQDYEGNYHKCGFSFEMLKSLLEKSGVHQIKRVINGYKGIPFVPDCLHVIGVKAKV
jgi:predicted SAM-dependent methyltransferase